MRQAFVAVDKGFLGVTLYFLVKFVRNEHCQGNSRPKLPIVLIASNKLDFSPWQGMNTKLAFNFNDVKLTSKSLENRLACIASQLLSVTSFNWLISFTFSDEHNSAASSVLMLGKKLNSAF